MNIFRKLATLLHKKRPKRRSKVDLLRDKLELMQVEEEFNQLQAKKGENNKKIAKNKYDTIVEEVKGMKKALEEAGMMENQESNEFDKLISFAEKMIEREDKKKAGLPNVDTIDVSPQSNGKPSNFNDQLKGIDLQDLEAAPAEMVKKKIIQLVRKAQE